MCEEPTILGRSTSSAMCWYCHAPQPGRCADPDPCPAWEIFKGDHPEFQEAILTLIGAPAV
jgi:hypothetical protein